MITEEEFLTFVGDRLQIIVCLDDDLVKVSQDSLQLVDILNELEDKYNVPLLIRSKLPLSYLYSLCSKSQ